MKEREVDSTTKGEISVSRQVVQNGIIRLDSQHVGFLDSNPHQNQMDPKHCKDTWEMCAECSLSSRSLNNNTKPTLLLILVDSFGPSFVVIVVSIVFICIFFICCVASSDLNIRIHENSQNNKFFSDLFLMNWPRYYLILLPNRFKQKLDLSWKKSILYE